jgi:hypothetical protein
MSEEEDLRPILVKRRPEGRRALVMKIIWLVFQIADYVDGVLNCLNFFSSVVWNFDSKFFFECHNQLHGVQAVCAQIIYEAVIGFNLVCICAKVFCRDFLYRIKYIAHADLSFSEVLFLRVH